MKKCLLKTMSLVTLLSASSASFALGQEGDSRVSGFGNLTFGDDTSIFLVGSMEKYIKDDLLLGGTILYLTVGDEDTIGLGFSGKKTFPNEPIVLEKLGDDIVPYVKGTAQFLMLDVKDVLALGVSAGADYYISENSGLNIDLQQGLTSDYYEDLTLSFGIFYEF